MRSGSGNDGHDRGDDRGLDFASKEPRSRRDRAPIATRSGPDGTTIVVLVRPPSAVRWRSGKWVVDVSFLCVVKTQIRWSNKIYKTELTKTRYNNQVLGKYRVDPQRAGLTLIAELTWSNLGLKGVLNKRK